MWKRTWSRVLEWLAAHESLENTHMTLPQEEVNSLNATRAFMYDLLNPAATPRVPREVRERARRVVKHFPFEVHVRARYPDVFGVSALSPSPESAELETLRAENARLRSALLRIEREVVDARWACVKPEEIPQVNTDWVLSVTDEALRQRLECELYKGEG